MSSLIISMSQTFLEDIPEFLEIQRDSFLRILDTGLIEAFEKINPISPTSQCKYGLLFYPKEYVLILPENTITEAFLQGKTYGCKIYVPAIIYDIENSSNSQKTRFSQKRFKFSKALKFPKTLSSREIEETLFYFGENHSKISSTSLIQALKSKSFFYKKNRIGIRGSSFFVASYLDFLEKKNKNHIKTVFPENGNLFDFQSLRNQDSLKSNSFKSSAPIWKWKSHILRTRKNKNNRLILDLYTAQKTKKKDHSIWSKKTEHISNVNSILPKAIHQKSKLGFFDKASNFLRGISNNSLIQKVLEHSSLQISEGSDFLTILNRKKTHPLVWFLPLSKRSLIEKQRKIKSLDLALAQKKELLENNFKSTKNSDLFSLKNNSDQAIALSSKEWVCIGVLPLMTPRGHFIINGSHRIIISQMARAPGLYYQTGDKLQATIVPLKGAWLRLNVKASDTGEIKVWVRITPQRKIPYKIFIETYKYLENSKLSVNSSSSKFVNLVYKTLNSKIKHLDKHYAIGVISGQITRTLLNLTSYSLGEGGRKRLNERLGINDKNGYLTSKDISIIKDNLLKLLGQKSNANSWDDIDHLKNRRVRTCGELLQVEIQTGMTRLKKAIGKQLDEYSNPDSSIFNRTVHANNDNLKNVKNKQNGENVISYNKEGFSNTLDFYSNKQAKNLGPIPFFKNFLDLSVSTRNLSEQNILLVNNRKKIKNQEQNQQKNLYVKSTFKKSNSLKISSKLVYQLALVGTSLASTDFLNSLYPVQKNQDISKLSKFDLPDYYSKKNFKKQTKAKENVLSPSKIIGTKAFAGALREFFGSNPLSQYMDQTNPLAEITHKRRLSSLGPGGIDRASAGIAIRGIHPSHYGRICPIETPEGKNAGLVNSMTMWARINEEGFLETPYFKVTGGSLMNHRSSLMEHWTFLSTKKESEQALKIVSSDLKITESAFLPSIALPTRDGSERSFGRQKRDYVQFCGVSPMQNISVATSLIPFLEHDDATRALMGSNMQRQAVPLLRATAPLIRTGLEGKVVGESGHALQASCSGIISKVTRTKVHIDSFEDTQKIGSLGNRLFSTQKSEKNSGIQLSSFLSKSTNFFEDWEKKQKFIGNKILLPFLKDYVSTKSFSLLSHNRTFWLENKDQKGLLQKNFSVKKLTLKDSPYFNDFEKKVYQSKFLTLSFLRPKKTWLSKLRNLKSAAFPKNLWRQCSKIQRHRKIHDLQQYSRSNQATVCVQGPAVKEGYWVQKGDLIGDCSASKNGVLALGQNIVVAYLPMEGFNFEDAIVVSDRLVHEELYTSIHVQRIEFDMDARVKKHIPRKIKVKKPKSSYKTNNQDWITFYNPHLLQSEKQNLNPLGIIKVGSWVGPGDVLVSKVFPVERKIAPSRHLLAAVFQEKKTKILDTDDTSVRVPKGIHGRVINVKITGTGKTASGSLLQSCAMKSLRQNKDQAKAFSLLGPENKPSLLKMSLNSEPFSRQSISQEKENSYLLSEFNEFTTSEKINGFNGMAVSKTNNSRLFLDNKEHSTLFFSSEIEPHLRNTEMASTCLSLEYQARKIKITGSKNQTSYLLANAKQNKLLTFNEKRKNSFNKTFVYCTSHDQAINLRSLRLPYSIFNKNIGSINNDSPSLIRKVLFPELKNNFSSRKVLLADSKFNFETQEANFFSNSNSPVELTGSGSFFNPNSLNGKQVNRFSNSFIQDSSEQNSGENKRKKYKSQKDPLASGLFIESKGVGSLSPTMPKTPTSSKNSTILTNQEYKITGVRIYIAERKKLQVGDKMSGRHGNKGIVSTILPREDMPYLPDGTPVDMVLNPLGIPSRMNVGQVFECLLGLAASICDKSIGHTPFDEMYGPEASRSLVYLFLYVSRLKSRADWIFQPNFPGKTLLFDGRTGTPFEQWVTVGRAYMLKLIHMVDEKIHARSIGPRSLVTQQPVKGRARGGGQRLGEMEIWALEGFGAAYTLQEILTIKSDDIKGREDVETSIISATALSSHIPETFRITLFELRCLCLNLELNQNF